MVDHEAVVLEQTHLASPDSGGPHSWGHGELELRYVGPLIPPLLKSGGNRLKLNFSVSGQAQESTLKVHIQTWALVFLTRISTVLLLDICTSNFVPAVWFSSFKNKWTSPKYFFFLRG